MQGHFCLNIASLILQSKSLVCIETIEDSELYIIPISKLQDAHSRNILDNLLLKQAQEQQNRMVSLLSQTSEERYREILKHRPELILRISQKMMAMYLGCEPETVSRIRKRIQHKK